MQKDANKANYGRIKKKEDEVFVKQFLILMSMMIL